ncbi:anion permease [Halarchaeum sp. P4]|uniref:inorganic phosphate transporter n=1 Tax=Halarchaeum sp. P4 TaxID=3421639 RepID=UPI003EBDBBFA
MSGLVFIAAAVLAAAFMAYTIGVNSNSAPILPAVGADALSVERAAVIVGATAALGALAQGQAVSATIGHGFVDGATVTPLATTAALLTTASFITLGNRSGYPIPSSFTVTGATIGAGIALGGSLATDTLLHVVAFWLSVPLVEVVVAFGVAYVLLRTDIPDTVTVPALGTLVGAVIATVRFDFLPEDGTLAATLARALSLPRHAAPLPIPTDTTAVALSFGVVLAVTTWYAVDRHGPRGVHWFLIALGGLVTFSSGGSQIGLAIGPLQPVIEGSIGLSTLALLGFGAACLVVGALVGAPDLIRAVADDYSDLGPYRSIAALVPAFLVAQAAIALGFPISFNKVMICGIVGAGLVDGLDGVSEGKTGYTVAAWGVSMVAAALVTFALYHAAATVTGVS